MIFVYVCMNGIWKNKSSFWSKISIDSYSSIKVVFYILLIFILVTASIEEMI